MHKLIDTTIDKKNIGLSKLLYELRQNLDVYYVIADNADAINKSGIGKNFFGHIQKLAIDSIILSICKIYEKEEKKYPLNSIDGVLHHLIVESPRPLDNSKLKYFIQKYGRSSEISVPISMVTSAIKEFRKRYKSELKCFETFRHKMVAHSEFGFDKDELPSEGMMEELFCFAADFYEVVSDSFVGVGPFNFMTWRRVKYSLERLLQELGIENISMDMKSCQQSGIEGKAGNKFLLTAES